MIGNYKNNDSFKTTYKMIFYFSSIFRMADDPTLKMYEAQAELVETRQELERIRRENDELKKERAVSHFMGTGQMF